jgi:hypothetical protein
VRDHRSTRLRPIIALCSAFLALSLAGASTCVNAAIIFSSSGANAAAIQGTVDSFRAALGVNNGVLPGPLSGGRREVNWDAIPIGSLDPFPGNFFQASRGIAFSTPGSRMKVSGDAGSPSFEFADVTALVPGMGPWGPIELSSFSSPRMFAPIDSVITDMRFFVPGTSQPAGVRGFGAVFVDVDLANTSKLTLLGANDAVLFENFISPSGVQSEGLTFLGVVLDPGVLASRVRIIGGSHPINTVFMDPPPDGIAIDDVIFAEPSAIPEPSTLALLGLSFAALGLARTRRHRARVRAGSLQ